jgi:tol-pal system protein YbgF
LNSRFGQIEILGFAMFKKSFFVFALLMSAASIPAQADDVTNRVDALEDQVRQLVGQIEELNYTVKQLQSQTLAAPRQTGEAQGPAVLAVPKKKLSLQAPAQAQMTGKVSDAGVETIEETPLQQDALAPAQDNPLYGDGGAPLPKVLGSMDNKAAKAGDGGFKGVIIDPPANGEVAIGETPVLPDPNSGVEQVSLQPETPDDVFMKAEKSLLQLQYQDAESGFKDFLTKYPDHNLAGSAQFKLGETFYAQQNFSEAAQNYLTGYKQYPKSRRAADSLLKLGLSLNKLGQKDQGCAALGSVGGEFPKAVEANKRAQAEFKRAGC